MKKINTLTLTTGAFSLFVMPLFALAQAPAPVAPVSNGVPVKNVEACAKITEKVTARITKYNEVQGIHDARFQQMVLKLKEISAKLKARSLDTNTLDAQIAVLEQKRSKLETDKQSLMSKLEESKNFTCGASAGQFKAKISEAKLLQKIVVADVKDIHDFAKTVRDTVKSFRAMTASSTPKAV